MLEVHLLPVAPEAEGSRESPEKGPMVFRVQVRCGDRRHTLLRSFREFHALHKRMKKLYKVPDFPSKRLPGWRTRGPEQQRLGLKAYIQGILLKNPEVPKELLEFLGLQHSPPDPRTSSWGSQRHHRPVVGFCQDPYMRAPSPEPLSSMVVRGVLQGLYDSQPARQPKACNHRPSWGEGTCPHSRTLQRWRAPDRAQGPLPFGSGVETRGLDAGRGGSGI